MAGLRIPRLRVRPLVTLFLLSLVVASVLAAPEPIVSLNDRITTIRYAYRARAPEALGGDGRLLLGTYYRQQLEPSPALVERIPHDLGLPALAIRTRDDVEFVPPFRADLRLRGLAHSAVRLYFVRQGGQEVYLRLDPKGDLPTRVAVEDDVLPANQALGFTTAEAAAAQKEPGLYSEYSIQFDPDTILVSSGGETRTISLDEPLGPVSLVLSPVVGQRLSIVDEMEVTGSTTSASARATYRLRPFLYPFDLETRLGDREALHVVVSLLLLAAAAVLFAWLRAVALRGRPDIRAQYAVGWLSLPAQIVALSAVRATLGLALLSMYVVVALLVIHEIYGLRRIRPQTTVFVIRSRRVLLSRIAAVFYIGLLAHVCLYRSSNLEEFSLGLGIVACAVVPVVALWRLLRDRRVWLWPTLVVLGQCLLFAPSKGFHPAVTPISFYALTAVIWIVAVLHSGQVSTTSRRLPAWGLALLSPVLLVVMVEVAVRGDHHLRHVTALSCIAAATENAFLYRALRFDREVHAERNRDTAIEMGGTAWRIDKPAGQFRIVCLGSSSTYGVGVDSFEHSYPAQLGELLRSSLGDDIVTINAGLAGARLSFLEFYVERVLLELDPDVVVLYFGWNGDPPDVAQGLERFTTFLDHRPAVTPTFEEVWASMQLRWPRPWLVGGMVRAMSCRTVNWLVITAQNVQACRAGNAAPSVERNESFELVGRSAHDIVELCRDRGVSILLVPEVTKGEVDEMCMADPAHCSHPYYQVFGSLAAHSPEDAVYSGTVLRDFPAEARAAQFIDEVHMDRAGYTRLALSIADLMLEAGIFDAQKSPTEGGPGDQ